MKKVHYRTDPGHELKCIMCSLLLTTVLTPFGVWMLKPYAVQVGATASIMLAFYLLCAGCGIMAIVEADRKARHQEFVMEYMAKLQELQGEITYHADRAKFLERLRFNYEKNHNKMTEKDLKAWGKLMHAHPADMSEERYELLRQYERHGAQTNQSPIRPGAQESANV